MLNLADGWLFAVTVAVNEAIPATVMTVGHHLKFAGPGPSYMFHKASKVKILPRIWHVHLLKAAAAAVQFTKSSSQYLMINILTSLTH